MAPDLLPGHRHRQHHRQGGAVRPGGPSGGTARGRRHHAEARARHGRAPGRRALGECARGDCGMPRGRWIPHRIAAVGLAGHGNGLYLLDKAGAPLLGIQSLDTPRGGAGGRARPATPGQRCTRSACSGPGRRRRRRCWPGSRRTGPRSMRRPGRSALPRTSSVWHLTGQRATEMSDMSGAGLLRLPEARL